MENVQGVRAVVRESGVWDAEAGPSGPQHSSSLAVESEDSD